MDRAPLFDADHLAAQTLGDAELAGDLLELFAQQCRRLVPGIADGERPPAERADLAHTLKGSALAVGAMRLAALAGEAEAALRVGDSTGEGHARALGEIARATLAATGP